MLDKTPSPAETIATALFVLAILHTFLTKQIHHISSYFARNSWRARLFRMLGEVELVFAIWSLLLIIFVAVLESPANAFSYLSTRNFSEAIFVFVIVTICGTRPILDFAELVITQISRILPVPNPVSYFATALTLGPILGSFITEPAAMTVSALLLKKHYFDKNISPALKYATLGTLFVNVSIGGTLTPFAAPPILMVAAPWGWDLTKMLSLFGWKGALSCALSTALLTLRFRGELAGVPIADEKPPTESPAWRQAVHLILLGAVIALAHHALVLITLLTLFYAFTAFMKERLSLKSGALVGIFLAGLVVIGGMQTWWLAPLLGRLNETALYLGAMALTAVTDNAALTYLGSLIPQITEPGKYALVAGAVVGGGLTVIANAPNPAGYGILCPSFGEDGVSPFGLFMAALTPTAIAAILFWIF